jgi:beta-xylosidase
MRNHFLKLAALIFAGFALHVRAGSARNPIIWADVPDPAVIRVGDTYYMSSTTMHLCPGVPVMKSKNLVNWEMVGYACQKLEDNDETTLQNGHNIYGRGSWASSLREHKGMFYATMSALNAGYRVGEVGSVVVHAPAL